jgi:hypothetical protein
MRLPLASIPITYALARPKQDFADCLDGTKISACALRWNAESRAMMLRIAEETGTITRLDQGENPDAPAATRVIEG